jgi:hypothetical protein
VARKRAREGRVTPGCGAALRLAELPSLSFGVVPKRTIRDFPDKLPIGLNSNRRTHVFLYLVNRETVDFRVFLHRHDELFRALPEWEQRLLVPRHLTRVCAAIRGSRTAGVRDAAAAGRRQ